jgi:hypothetical protein
MGIDSKDGLIPQLFMSRNEFVECRSQDFSRQAGVVELDPAMLAQSS